MSNNNINKNFHDFTDYKYHINNSLNNSIIGDIPSNTPHKDYFFHLRPQMNMNNIPNSLMFDLKSPNKLSSFSLKKKKIYLTHFYLLMDIIQLIKIIIIVNLTKK